MRKYLVGVAVMVFLAAATVRPALADSSDEWSPNFVLKDAPRTITGLVERTDDGLAIRSGGSEYKLAGNDLSNLVGKRVAATGEITDFGGNKTISVTSARTCEYC
jgi:hypothetical protein